MKENEVTYVVVLYFGKSAFCVVSEMALLFVIWIVWSNPKIVLLRSETFYGAELRCGKSGVSSVLHIHYDRATIEVAN